MPRVTRIDHSASRAGARGVVSALLLSTGIAVHAQNPFIEAARSAAPPALPDPAAAVAVVRVFIEACVAHEGDATAIVDWALGQGFEAVEARDGPGATLLSGRPGTVMAMPGGAAPVLLAVDAEKRCTVWAERADGPAVRAEFSKAVSALAGQGARVQPAPARTVERAGAWRQHWQVRLRRAGSTQDFAIGSVTTFTATPTSQVLGLAPAADAPAAEPPRPPAR